MKIRLVKILIPKDEQTKKVLDWLFSDRSVHRETWFNLGKSWNNLLRDHFY